MFCPVSSNYDVKTVRVDAGGGLHSCALNSGLQLPPWVLKCTVSPWARQSGYDLPNSDRHTCLEEWVPQNTSWQMAAL